MGKHKRTAEASISGYEPGSPEAVAWFEGFVQGRERGLKQGKAEAQPDAQDERSELADKAQRLVQQKLDEYETRIMYLEGHCLGSSSRQDKLEDTLRRLLANPTGPSLKAFWELVKEDVKKQS